jgi:hypothetical protein
MLIADSNLLVTIPHLNISGQIVTGGLQNQMVGEISWFEHFSLFVRRLEEDTHINSVFSWFDDCDGTPQRSPI